MVCESITLIMCRCLYLHASKAWGRKTQSRNCETNIYNNINIYNSFISVKENTFEHIHCSFGCFKCRISKPFGLSRRLLIHVFDGMYKNKINKI